MITICDYCLWYKENNLSYKTDGIEPWETVASSVRNTQEKQEYKSQKLYKE
jgi:hypothetical protein